MYYIMPIIILLLPILIPCAIALFLPVSPRLKWIRYIRNILIYILVITGIISIQSISKADGFGSGCLCHAETPFIPALIYFSFLFGALSTACKHAQFRYFKNWRTFIVTIITFSIVSMVPSIIINLNGGCGCTTNKGLLLGSYLTLIIITHVIYKKATRIEGDSFSLFLCIKGFFNWKDTSNRKTFLIRFSILQLFALPPCIFYIVISPSIATFILGFLFLYMNLCILYQYIKTAIPMHRWLSYFSWIVLFLILIGCSFPIIGLVMKILLDYGVSTYILAILWLSSIPLSPIFLAWLLSTHTILFCIQKIVELPYFVCQRGCSIFHKNTE